MLIFFNLYIGKTIGINFYSQIQRHEYWIYFQTSLAQHPPIPRPEHMPRQAVQTVSWLGINVTNNIWHFSFLNKIFNSYNINMPHNIFNWFSLAETLISLRNTLLTILKQTLPQGDFCFCPEQMRMMCHHVSKEHQILTSFPQNQTRLDNECESLSYPFSSPSD